MPLSDPLFALRVRRQLFCTFEVDVARLDPLVPAPLTPVEPKPGVGLLSVSVVDYAPGQLGRADAPATEVVAAVHVAPDLSLAMPLARFALHTVRVYTDDPRFIAEKAARLSILADLVPDLQVDWTDDGSGADVSAGGRPLARLRDHHPEPAPVPGELWGQWFAFRDRRLVRGPWAWTGAFFGHQKRGGPSALLPHAFFEGIGPVGACHTYMWAAPGENGMRFWEG